jgi:lipoprotein-anchoring transpeptidase ErfK/SrfK
MNGLRQLAAVTACAMAAMTAGMNMQTRHLHAPQLASLWPAMTASAAPLASTTATLPAVPKPALVAKPAVVKPAAAPIAIDSPTVSPPAPAAMPKPPDPTLAPAIDAAALAQQSEGVAERLRDRVPAALFPYFDEYLYVSKAANGAWAQHMYMFHKADDGDLVYEQAFPVSTGREHAGKIFHQHAIGHVRTRSRSFRSRALFASLARRGDALGDVPRLHDSRPRNGIAMHSAEGHAFELGHRASGGCIRLPPEKAEELFKRFQAEERGRVPVFAFDDSRATTFTDGSHGSRCGGQRRIAGRLQSACCSSKIIRADRPSWRFCRNSGSMNFNEPCRPRS